MAFLGLEATTKAMGYFSLYLEPCFFSHSGLFPKVVLIHNPLFNALKADFLLFKSAKSNKYIPSLKNHTETWTILWQQQFLLFPYIPVLPYVQNHNDLLLSLKQR